MAETDRLRALLCATTVMMNAELGELTVRDVIHEWPFHDRERQLLENTRALLWPGLGGAQCFTELHGQRPPHS